NHFVLNFLQARELSQPALGLVKVLRSGERVVTKKSLRSRFRGTKQFLLQFSEENPGVLEDYKRFKAEGRDVEKSDLEEGFNERVFAGVLVQRLQQIPSGPT